MFTKEKAERLEDSYYIPVCINGYIVLYATSEQTAQEIADALNTIAQRKPYMIQTLLDETKD